MPSQQAEPTQQTNPAVAEHKGTLPAGLIANDSTIPPRRRKHLTRWLIATAVLLSSVLAWFLSLTSPLQLLELKTYDSRFVLNEKLRFVLYGKQPPPAGIILAQIDAETEAAFPDEPHIFWHLHYAEMMRAAAAGGARAIGLDVSFALSVEPWEPDYDRQLAAAFAEVSATTPVVLAYDNLPPGAQDLPLYILASAMGAIGYAELTLDADGFIRRQELISGDKSAYESFAARLAAVTLKASWSQPNAESEATGDSQPRTLMLGDHTVPLDSSGFLLIHYWGPAGTFPAVSMAKVLRAQASHDTAALEEWFKGKVVLVGTSDPSDQHSTPFFLAGKEKDGETPGEKQALTPGVEIHANALATLLEGRYLQKVPLAWQWALVLAAALLAAFCIVGMRFPLGPLLLIGAVAAFLAASVLSLGSGWVLPVVSPVLAVILSGLTSYGAQALTEGRQKRLLQEVFGRYVSAEVAAELLEYGEVPLGGIRQPVTVMFTDLRNYTHYCQGRDPRQVVEELNEYFAEMSSEIKAHGGMINKFIGDGIMALFGAPVPHPDDARRAVACALKMIERNEEYNQRRVAAGLAPLAVGVGIHTGEAVVGNIGAPEKMEYTAIGDAVNIASRIEGENKTFGTSLLISPATHQQVADQFAAEPAGSAKMKGIDEPMILYKVHGVK
ncbi:MAG: adenylate/guanylate cyclase domain-containing protein [Acidobacteria bacterium]|nr:adenylate/guanylate cyclase domain-containing protein [Acidobacteriota bacterium]